MKILNTGIDTAKHDTQEIYEALQAERSGLLGHTRDLQLAARLLIQAEGQRLTKQNPADARVAKLAAIEQLVRARVTVLDTELEVAAIRVPPVTKTDALVHGRITDDAQKAAGRVSVMLVRADGRPLAGVKPVELDDSGYFAFVIDPQTAATLTPTDKLSVVVQRGDATVVPSAAAGFTLSAGTVAVKDVALNDAELRKLQLRADVTFRTAAPTVARAAGAAPREAKPKAAPKRRGGKAKK